MGALGRAGEGQRHLAEDEGVGMHAVGAHRHHNALLVGRQDLPRGSRDAGEGLPALLWLLACWRALSLAAQDVCQLLSHPLLQWRQPHPRRPISCFSGLSGFLWFPRRWRPFPCRLCLCSNGLAFDDGDLLLSHIRVFCNFAFGHQFKIVISEDLTFCFSTNCCRFFFLLCFYSTNH